TEYRHMQTPGNLHVHHGQSNWDTCPALQNLVQATVQRIEKIRLVAMESELAKKVAAGFFDELTSVVEISKTIAQPRRELVQLVQKRLRLQIRKMDAGQIQRCPVHADLGVLPGQDLLQ